MKDRPLNIFFISPVFVPTAGPEPYCGGKMALALMEHGVSATVVSLDDHRRTRLDDSRVWKPLSPHHIAVETPKTKEPVRSAFLGARYLTNSYARWIRSVVGLARELHSAKPFDVVYSRSLPMIAHVAGYWCGRKLGLPWIANMNDPWALYFFPGNKRKASRRVKRWSMYWLRKTLRRADLVTYPSAGLHTFHAALSGVEHDAEIIPHVGFASNDGIPGEGFTLVHAGKMGNSEITGRPTNALLKGYASFLKRDAAVRKETRLVFVGPQDEETDQVIRTLDLQGNVVGTGMVSYEESLKKIKEATVCILIEADEKEGIYLPSKLADYLVAGKPVLALSPEVGTASGLARAGGLVRVRPNDPVAVEKALAKLYGDYRRGCLGLNEPPPDLVAQFTAQAVAEKFIAAASQVMARHRGN